MKTCFDPDGTRLPIKLDTTSNGEFAPLPLPEQTAHARHLAAEACGDNAKRTGRTRRQFMTSAAGVATTLLAMNTANAAAGKTGGMFALAPDAPLDDAAAQQTLAKREFIFDVQGHYVPPSVARTLKPECSSKHARLSREYMRCLGADSFIKDVFVDSDTDMMVLSFVPSARDKEPLTIEEAAATREIVEKMDGSHRLLIHGRVNPNQPGDVEAMDVLAEDHGVSAWKTYTQWGPDGEGFFMTDDVGIAFVEKARKLGVKNICIHKGIPFGRKSYEHSLCSDIGPIAKRFPDVNFLIYHSGWVPGQAEGPLQRDRNEGLDGLINSLLESDVGPGSNVYAELGSTWRGLIQDVDSAAHGLGKLVKYVGEENVLWGTDSIWYGSPQDQIQAFRSFSIDQALIDAHGYQPMTDELRARIFGLNALRPYGIELAEARRRASASDPVAGLREMKKDRGQDPHYLTFGPRNRREFLQFLTQAGTGP